MNTISLIQLEVIPEVYRNAARDGIAEVLQDAGILAKRVAVVVVTGQG